MASGNDPANIPYIIAENGFYYVAYKEKVKVPEVVVSAKGVANGLSTEYNDGYDFGPDSYDPNSTANPPYTQSDGFLEAWNYAVSIASPNARENPDPPEIRLGNGLFTISAPITLTAPFKVGNLHITGDSSMSPYIQFAVNDAYGITIDPSVFSNINMRWENMQFIPAPDYSPYGALNADFSSTNTNENVFEGYNLNISTGGWTETPIRLKSFRNIIMYNYEAYSNTGSIASGGDFSALNASFFGGKGAAGSSGIKCVYSGTGIGGTFVTFGLHTPEWQIAGWANALIDTTAQLVLWGDIGYLHINVGGSQGGSNYPFIASGTSGTTYNIGTCELVGTLQSAVNFFSGITIGNFINKLNYNGQSVSNLLVNTPSTPTVPASATAQQNTNPYAVDVYIYGGDVTEIQITKNGTAYTVLSVSSAIAMSGQVYKLNPGDSITVTYSTAPSWEWLSD
jgi:hypothetical protein